MRAGSQVVLRRSLADTKIFNLYMFVATCWRHCGCSLRCEHVCNHTDMFPQLSQQCDTVDTSACLQVNPCRRRVTHTTNAPLHYTRL